MLLLDERSKKTWKSDDEKTVIFDVYGWLRSHHPQPTSPSIHQEKHWLLSFNYYYTQFPRALAKHIIIIIAAKIHNSMHSTNNPIRKKTLWLKANETQITWLQNVEENTFFEKNTAATQQSPKSRPRSQKRKPPPPISNPHHSEHHVIKKRSKPLSVIELKIYYYILLYNLQPYYITIIAPHRKNHFWQTQDYWWWQPQQCDYVSKQKQEIRTEKPQAKPSDGKLLKIWRKKKSKAMIKNPQFF